MQENKLILDHQIIRHSSATDWVTFVHGAGGSSAIWYKQIKAFKKEFNVLLVNLRGHGKNAVTSASKDHYTFTLVSEDLKHLLDHLNIQNSHFVGISLGTILIRMLGQKHPHMVKSMILGGAIVDLDLRTNFLLSIGRLIRFFAPYLWLYKLFAFIIMPRNNHKEARALFIREAKQLNQKEFLRWFKLAGKLRATLGALQKKQEKLKTLYIMGVQDHLFLNAVQSITSKSSHSQLLVVQNAGHVVNLDQSSRFNEIAIEFIRKL